MSRKKKIQYNDVVDFDLDEYPHLSDDELRERAYSFHFVLYPDSKDYQLFYTLSLVQHEAENNTSFRFAYILHNKEDIKDHYHLIVKWPTQKILKTVLDMFAIKRYNPTDDMPEIKRWPNMVNYIIHNTKKCIKEGKYQYPTTSVISNFDTHIAELRYPKDLHDSFLEIVDYIKAAPYINMSVLISYCRDNPSLMNALCSRKYNFMITQLLRERNYV